MNDPGPEEEEEEVKLFTGDDKLVGVIALLAVAEEEAEEVEEEVWIKPSEDMGLRLEEEEEEEKELLLLLPLVA